MEAYLLKSAACLAIFYVFYKLVLEQQTVHRFKRIYLLASLIIAAIIPSIVFTTYIETAPTALTSFPINPGVLATGTDINTAPTVNYTPIILWSLYGIGVFIFGNIFFRNLFQIIRKIQQNPKEKSVSVYRVLLQMAVIPHTFFNYVFLNKEDYKNGNIPEEVLLHEEAHAVQKHSIDVLFIEVLQVVFWFNPFIWLYKRSIKLNHEFLADRAVLETGADAYKYSNLLLAFSSNASSPVLANSIIHSSTRLTALFSSNAFGQVKKRLTIMKTKTSKKATLLRSLLLLPLLAGLIYSFSTKETIPLPQNETTIASSGVNISEEKSNIDLKIIKLTVDFETIILNGNVSTLETFKNDVNAATKDWTEKDYKTTQPRITFTNANEEFLNALDKEFKKTTYSKKAGGYSIFFPHVTCKPEHLGNNPDSPIVKYYKTDNLSKDEIIEGLENVKGEKTTYYTNGNRASLREATSFVNKNTIRSFQIVSWAPTSKYDVYISDSKKPKLPSNIPPPPPPPSPKSPKVLKGEKSNIPPPPPAPKSPKVMKGDKSTIPPPPPPPPAPKVGNQETGSVLINGDTFFFVKDGKGIRYYDKWGIAVNENGEKITPANNGKK